VGQVTPPGNQRTTQRLDEFQQAHPGVGFPLAVIYKFFDDQGGYLAALITYYGFLSVFPLLLLLTSVLGFLLEGNKHLQQQILDSALRQFPVIGQQLGDPKGLSGSTTAVVIGLLGSLYGALGVAQAAQNAMNIMWAVPRNRRPNPIVSRLRSVLLLGVGGLTFLLTAVLTGVGNNVNGVATGLGAPVRAVATALSIALTAAFFMFLFRFSTTRALSRFAVLPGAIGAAVVWQLLQHYGKEYVGGVVRHTDATNGVFAIVLGLIAWIYLATLSLLLCVEANVVLVRQLYPRTLLTPFTDDVDLTEADQRAYRSYARAQRTKEFESVDVSFENGGQNATAQRKLRADRDSEPEPAALPAEPAEPAVDNPAVDNPAVDNAAVDNAAVVWRPPVEL